MKVQEVTKMPMTEGSIAYDLTVRKEKQQEETGAGARKSTRHVVSAKTVKLNKLSRQKQVTAPLPVVKAFHSLDAHQWKLVILSGAAFFALMSFFLISISYQVKENELAAAIAEREQRLESLQNDYDGLMVKYDNKMSDAAIEEYARTKLGMQKRERFQMEWIEVGKEDDFENDDAEKNGLIDQFKSYFD